MLGGSAEPRVQLGGAVAEEDGETAGHRALVEGQCAAGLGHEQDQAVDERFRAAGQFGDEGSQRGDRPAHLVQGVEVVAAELDRVAVDAGSRPPLVHRTGQRSTSLLAKRVDLDDSHRVRSENQKTGFGAPAVQPRDVDAGNSDSGMGDVVREPFDDLLFGLRFGDVAVDYQHGRFDLQKRCNTSTLTEGFHEKSRDNTALQGVSLRHRWWAATAGIFDRKVI
nr:hypothetical protein [Nocardia aobensis]